jgi:transcriptional repressor of dcmA and dcmR
MTDSHELLNIEQAARFLNVSETSLRRWTNSGQLACLRVGRRRERRFRRADLLAFAEHQPAHGGSRQSHPAGPPRQAPAIHYPEIAPGTHLCGVYSSDAGRVDLAVAFLAEGLYQGSVCFLSAAASVRAAILSKLDERGPSLRRQIESGRLVLSKYAASPQPQLEYWETQFQKALRAGAHSLRVVGDVWGIGKAVSPKAVVEYEASYERLARRLGAVTLCQYDARRFSSRAILDALRAHGDMFRYPVERLLG